MIELALLSYLIFGLVFVYVRLGALAPVTFLAATNLISCVVLYWVTQQALGLFNCIFMRLCPKALIEKQSTTIVLPASG